MNMEDFIILIKVILNVFRIELKRINSLCIVYMYIYEYTIIYFELYNLLFIISEIPGISLIYKDFELNQEIGVISIPIL